MQKKHILPALAVGLALGTGAILVSSSQVSAWMGNGGDQSSFAQQFAERFGLNSDEVESFMEETRSKHMEEMQTQRQTELENRLDAAVAEGKITEEQKQLLLEKHQEMTDEMESNHQERQENREERQAERESHHQEMTAWAEANGIDLDLMMELMGGPNGGHNPMGPGFGRHMNN